VPKYELTSALTLSSLIPSLLADGWEPFAVDAGLMWLRRLLPLEARWSAVPGGYSLDSGDVQVGRVHHDQHYCAYTPETIWYAIPTLQQAVALVEAVAKTRGHAVIPFEERKAAVLVAFEATP